MNWLEILKDFGYPVLVSLALGWWIKDTTDKNDAKVMELFKIYRDDRTESTKALENNTLVLQMIKETLLNFIKEEEAK